MKYYLYGLQRSGTNVIQSFLETNFNISMNNNNNKQSPSDRQSPSHKHFRIYDDKTIIPKTTKMNQYTNEYTINSVEELDELLEDSNGTNRYIIVYKNIFSWLPSIEKWAKNCKWETNSKMEFVNDYLNFMKKWYSIRNNRVIFIKYEDFLTISNENNALRNKLSVFFNHNLTSIEPPSNKVRWSDKFTNVQKSYYLNHEYMSLYSKEDLDKIIH